MDEQAREILGLPLDCAIERLRALGRWSDDWTIMETRAPRARVCADTKQTARVVRVVKQQLTVAYFPEPVGEDEP